MIRKAKSSDSAQLAELFSQLHRHHCEIAPRKHRMPSYEFFEKGIEEILADDEQTVLVNCEENGNEINAYAVFKIIDINSEQKSSPKGVLYRLLFGCRGYAKKGRRQSAF